MNKKILSLVLALVMVLGTFSNVFAETKAADKKEEKPAEKVEKIVGKDNKIQYIIDKKLVQGYEDGSYKLDKNITRAEITRLLVLANGNEELSKKLQGSMKIYSDVDASHWANGVITVGTTVPSDANGIAMLAGYPDKSFKPDQDVTYAELAKMLVVLAKKDLTPEMVKNAIWASSWMTWAQQLGILDDVTIADSNKAANRADAFTMVYNALYKMTEFKREPANEVRGIISTLNKDKLILNQDSKKEYKITSTTVTLDGRSERTNQVYRTTDTNFGAYIGSLVRILINDKNEVTHVIVLGDPNTLARNNGFGEVKENNSVWKGVARNTVNTIDYDWKKANLNEINKPADNVAYATLELNGKKLGVDSITFHNVNPKANVKNLTLAINDETEIYVANPYNGIDRKVTMTEALALIGYRNFEGKDAFRIPGVYAGFNGGADHKAAVRGYDSIVGPVAKVIVFNVVAKDEGSSVYRVVNSESSRFGMTLEDTKGVWIDKDTSRNVVNFAFNSGDLHDVIEVRNGATIETYIDHSDVDRYPVAVVERIYDNDRVLVRGFVNNERSLLNLSDAKIFNAKQYKDLRVGDYLQFATKDRDVEVKYVSLFPAKDDVNGKIEEAFKKSGSLHKVVKTEEDRLITGIVTYVSVEDKAFRITQDFDSWKLGKGYAEEKYTTDKAELENVKVGDRIKFKLNANKKGDAIRIELDEANYKNFAEKRAAEAAAEVDTELAKLTNNVTIRDLDNTKLKQEEVLASAKAKVEQAVDTKKVDVKVELVEAPANSANYAAAGTVKVKVTLTHKTVKTVSKEKTIEGNVAAAAAPANGGNQAGGADGQNQPQQ